MNRPQPRYDDSRGHSGIRAAPSVQSAPASVLDLSPALAQLAADLLRAGCRGDFVRLTVALAGERQGLPRAPVMHAVTELERVRHIAQRVTPTGAVLAALRAHLRDLSWDTQTRELTGSWLSTPVAFDLDSRSSICVQRELLRVVGSVKLWCRAVHPNARPDDVLDALRALACDAPAADLPPLPPSDLERVADAVSGKLQVTVAEVALALGWPADHASESAAGRLLRELHWRCVRLAGSQRARVYRPPSQAAPVVDAGQRL